MKEQLLAIQSQTVYAKDTGKKPMADAVPTEVPREHVGEARRVREFTQTDREEKAVKDGMEDFLREKVEEAKQEKNSQQEAQAAQQTNAVLEERIEQKKALPPQKYFREVPVEASVAQYIHSFCLEAEGKPLEEFDTRFLTKHYLLLRQKAAEQGARTDFLSTVKDELSKRGINTDRPFTQANARYERFKSATGGTLEMRGGSPDLDLTGITDPTLQRYGEAINRQIAAVGEDYEVLNNRWGEVNALSGTVPQDQKDRLLDEVAQAMQWARREAQQRAEEMRERERERPPGTGWYGERILTAEDRRAIADGVNELVGRAGRLGRLPTGVELEQPTLDSYFNRIFDTANGLPRLEFERALGTSGEKEYTDLRTTLTDIKQQAEKAYEQDRNNLEAKRQAEIVQMLITKYGEEYAMRRLLHNTFYIAESEGEFQEFSGYCKQFAAQFGDLAFLNAPEVEAALRIRENVLYQFKRENKGFIPPEKVSYAPHGGVSEWEERTKKLLEELNNKLNFGAILPEWKVNRALSISRGMGMVLLRFPEIVAEEVLPAPASTYQSQPSVPWEKLVWGLNPLDHLIKRFQMYKDVRAILFAAMKRSKGAMWSQEELRESLNLDLITAFASSGDTRVIDLRNLFRTGGPFTHTGWRPYTAALDEHRDQLKPLLKRNGGLAIHLIFNRYENLNLNAARWQFTKDYERDHPGADQRAILRAWQEKEQELRKSEDPTENPKIVWSGEEKDFWIEAAKRIPHVVLRIITDPANKLMGKAERAALLREIFGEDDSARVYTEAEEDLTLAKEHLMMRRRQAGEAWTSDEDQLIEADFEVISEEGGRRENAKKLHRIVVEKLSTDATIMGNILKKIEDPNLQFPFALTGEDVPWSEYRFGQTGSRGFFTRKINDAFTSWEASDQLTELIKSIKTMQSPEQITAKLNDIFRKEEIYDFDQGRYAVRLIATGIVRFFQKDGMLKIPILGEILGLIRTGRQYGDSFAQTVYGGRAMSWDSDDIYNFTEQLRPILTYDDIKEIRKETGGQWWRGLGARTKIAFYLLMLFFTYELTKRTIEEK